MAHEAGQTTVRALRAGCAAWAVSRLAILAVAVLSAALAADEELGAANAASFDRPALTRPLGAAGDALLSPLARWDAVWYLEIAASGYPADDAARPAFFPLYPLLVRAVGELGGGSPAALLIAAYTVSLAALLAALVLLYRLTELELGEALARSTLLLLSVFPASLFLGAPYSESLFLLCAVGAFLAARHDRFVLAGLAAAAASATRSAGLLLVVPLALIYLYGPRGGRSPEAERALGRRPPGAPGEAGGGAWTGRLAPRYPLRRDAAWLALAPAGIGAYALALGLAHGDPLAFVSAQSLWGRELGGPLVGAWEGLRAGAEGLRTLVAGPPATATASPIGDPTRIAVLDVALLGTLVLALAATVGVLRRLPAAYGAWILAALGLALSYPVQAQPLMSLPRFVAVLFPFFMWLALACGRRRLTAGVAVASAALLGVCVAQFAAWHFIA